MDKIQDLYIDMEKSFEDLDNDFTNLKLLIDFLVFEKKVLHMTDTTDKLEYYMQPKFEGKMNEHLKEYKENKQ